LEDPGEDWRIILKLIFRGWMGWGQRLDLSVSGLGQVASSFKCGHESSGSIKWGNFLSSLGRVSISGRTLLQAVTQLMKFEGP
jgi:hypothetical protein